MRLALRILIVFAAIWALLAPLSYGVIFGLFFDWSAIVDLSLAFACMILAYSECKNIRMTVRISAFLVVLGFLFADLLRNFRATGESGPLPFEWINGYFWQALPLLFLSAISILTDRVRLARIRNATNVEQAVPPKSDRAGG